MTNTAKRVATKSIRPTWETYPMKPYACFRCSYRGPANFGLWGHQTCLCGALVIKSGFGATVSK